MSKVQSLKCPNCGAAIYDKEAVRCEYCGSALSIEGEESLTLSEPSAPGYSWVCPECGGVTPPNFRFCIKCGAAAGDNPIKAPKAKPKPPPSPAPARPAPEPVRVARVRKNPLKGIGRLLSGLTPFFVVIVVVIAVLYFNGGLPSGAKNFIDGVLGKGLAIFGEFNGNNERDIDESKMVRVLAGWTLDLCDAPGGRGAVIGELKPGEEMAALEVQGEWYRVHTADGREGWVQYIIRGARVVG